MMVWILDVLKRETRMRNRRLKDASLAVHGEKNRSFDDDDDRAKRR